MTAFSFPLGSPLDPRRHWPVGDFLNQVPPDEEAAESHARNVRIALLHFGRFLRRPPLVSDLTTDAIGRLAAWLVSIGKQPGTANRVANDLIRAGTLATQAGILDVAPSYVKLRGNGQRRAPLSGAELERLLAACLQQPGDMVGLPAKRWWPAFLLTILNTELSAVALLQVRADALDPVAGTLRAQGLVYWLHRHTADSLTMLANETAREYLFPWPATAKNPIDMLLYHFRRLLQSAGVASQPRRAFDRLRITVEQEGTGILDKLDVARIERERQALADRERADEIRRQETKRQRRKSSPASAEGSRRRMPPRLQSVYAVANHTPRSLRRFLHEEYARVRLAGRSPHTLQQYDVAINTLASYRGCEVTLDQLSPALLEGAMAWMVQNGRSPHSANRIFRAVRAIWRFAMRRRFLPWTAEIELVERMATKKREPKAWTLAELETLLAAASTAEGEYYGLPVQAVLPAAVLTVFYSGIRIGALLQLRTADLDLKTGWLTVPAEIQKHCSDQVFRLPPNCLASLMAIDPSPREYIFGRFSADGSHRATDTRAAQLRRRLKIALTAAGLPAGRRDCFHKVRRTSATQMVSVAGDAAAQSHLGHSDPSLLRFYVDRTQLAKPQAADLLPKLNWQPPVE